MINNNMQMPFNDPNAYLQMYAQKNNLDIETAKAELQAKYGDPNENGTGAPEETTQGNIFASATNENTLVDTDTALEEDESFDYNEIFSLNLSGVQKEETEESKSVDKEAVIQALMDKADISYNDAKNALQSLGIEDGSEQIDPDEKLASFVNVTGLDKSEAKEFLTKYIGEPKKA